jgi:aspartyl-tRNA(Asn)/glutamyl-tRNA(Gln) amidotransferase subunit A
MSIIDRTAWELLADLANGHVSSVEVTRGFLDRVQRCDGEIHAFLACDADHALSQADAIDQKRRRGERLGRLAGLPVAVKDVLCTRGQRTTCASKMLARFVPPYDATVVARLKAADAVILGKTNMDEFAMGGSGENSSFGPTRNPWDISRIPGGSSSGSAAAVAARMSPVAIGSDTGGSIRQPAGLCGITGLKPTYGRVSRFGLVAFASSLDQVGPFAQTAQDAALVLETLAGHDPCDSTSLNVPVPKYTESITQPIAGLRLGVAREHFGEGLDGEVERAVREAIRVYQSLGATVHDISLPHAKYAVATYYVIAPCEASSNLARYDGVHYGFRAEKDDEPDSTDNPLVRMYQRTRAEGFGTEVKRRIMLGTYALSAGYYDAYYLKALKVRRLIRQDFDEAFKQIDLIIGPVSPTTAMKIGEKSDDPLGMYLLDLYTVSANLAGLPGIAFPCGFSRERLPIGVQLQGPALSEDRLLRAAHAFQQATDWHTRRPALTTDHRPPTTDH